MGGGGPGAGSASTSSSATSAFNNNAGITINGPNYAMWIVIGLAVLVGGLWLIRRS